MNTNAVAMPGWRVLKRFKLREREVREAPAPIRTRTTTRAQEVALRVDDAHAAPDVREHNGWPTLRPCWPKFENVRFHSFLKNCALENASLHCYESTRHIDHCE